MPDYEEEMDTITLRFLFVSDSIQTNKEGWLIGAVHIDGSFEGISQLYDNKYINVFPNPANDILNIRSHTDCNNELQIYDSYGRLIFRKILSANIEQINITEYPPGVYYIRTSKDHSRGRKVIIY